MAKGVKTGGGSRAGKGNKATLLGKARLERYGGEAIEFHYAVLTNNVDCAVCKGVGKTKFQPGNSDKFSGERTCQSCWGSKKERIDPKTRQGSADALLDRYLPKLKSIEHSGAEDKPPVGIRVVLVKAGA